MKLFEEFKLYENLFEDAAAGKEHPWMKDVPLVYPELNMGSNPNDPEDDILIKYTYLAGPEDVAEILDSLITEEDVAGTGYDLQALKAGPDAWYDFLDINFDRLVDKYDEELLNAFEAKAVDVARRKFENDYYYGNSEYIHESSDPGAQLKEDNMADMRRSIRAEIAQLEAEKAADTDPYSAVYYDEQIAACKAELAQLADLAPSKATAKKRALKAEREEKTKEIERRLRHAFRGLFKYFGHPHCASLKDGSWLVIFKRRLTPVAATEAVDICSKAGLQIKYSTEHSNNGSAFKLDVDNSDLDNHSYAWLNNIDYDAIEARLEAEQYNSNTNGVAAINEHKTLRRINKMKLHEEFKLYENMWDNLDVAETAEATETVDIFENLKTALIDSFTTKGYSEEVEILEKCTIRSSFELPWGGKDTIVMLTTDNNLYIHPSLAKPENFDKASLAVRIEFAYVILGIHMTPDKRDFASVRSAVAAVRARLTK